MTLYLDEEDGASLQALIDVSVPQTSDCCCHQKLNDANDITDYCYMCVCV